MNDKIIPETPAPINSGPDKCQGHNSTCTEAPIRSLTVTHKKDNGPTKAGTVVVSYWCDDCFDNMIPGVNLFIVMNPGAVNVKGKNL